MRREVPPTVLGWLRDCSTEALDEKLVPGANEKERRRLAALGGLAQALNATNDDLLPAGVWSWFADGPKPPEDIAKAAREWAAADPDAALASLYAALVASGNRRTLGTFFTPSAEARLMLQMWSSSQEDPDEVTDIGAGVGVFTAAARAAWDSARIVAVDVNPVTLGLLALHPQVATHLRAPGDPLPGIELVLDDFTKWVSNEAPSAARRLYLGNPPYTRAQLLPRGERVRLQEEVGELCGGRSSLSTVITALCLLQMRPHDGLCLLLPAQWLESDYARPLRRYLWGQCHRRIELRLVDSGLFADAQVDAVALLVGAAGDAPQALAVGAFEGALRDVDRGGSNPANWRAMFQEAPQAATRTVGAKSTTLGDLAQVRRGMATGANAFFLLKPTAIRDHDLPAEVLRPVVRRLNDIGNAVSRELFDEKEATEPRFVLVAKAEDRQKHEALDVYLRSGEDQELDQRELCSRRDVWFDVNHDVFVPHVIISAMTRGKFRIVTNDADAIITNNLYGWRWKSNTSKTTRTRTIAWLRSKEGQAALRSAARSQGDGLFKLEPRALRDLPLP
ncbi:MAG: hypothetical protein ACOYEV_16865 [Candidatus Nanopelagicales bacterium]